MKIDLNLLAEEIQSGGRVALSRGITLLESNKAEDRELSNELINKILTNTGKSFRIGITGSPGIGKSTFIDTLGLLLVNQGHKVAVLAIDPSSVKSGGSILGDKTRMQRLAASDHAFIRPSPSSGQLGGVGERTYESILLCEAAGYNIILIETVGVGQSEITVSELSDMILFLTIANTGDDLQGIKRGIMESVDLIVINKTDLYDACVISELKKNLYHAIHLFSEKESHYSPKVLTVSSIEDYGISDVWFEIENYFSVIHKNGYFESNRNAQKVIWMQKLLETELWRSIKSKYKDILSTYHRALVANEMSPHEAAKRAFKEIGSLTNL